MEHSREESKKDSGRQQGRSERSEAHHERSEEVRTKNNVFDSGKRYRILQCLGNLNALNKVQGALLGQIEREIE